jgi:hypothetical protein
MVVGSGITSNRLSEFIDALYGLGKLFEAPPKLNGKSFQWEQPLAKAA